MNISVLACGNVCGVKGIDQSLCCRNNDIYNALWPTSRIPPGEKLISMRHQNGRSTRMMACLNCISDEEFSAKLSQWQNAYINLLNGAVGVDADMHGSFNDRALRLQSLRQKTANDVRALASQYDISTNENTLNGDSDAAIIGEYQGVLAQIESRKREAVAQERQRKAEADAATQEIARKKAEDDTKRAEEQKKQKEEEITILNVEKEKKDRELKELIIKIAKQNKIMQLLKGKLEDSLGDMYAGNKIRDKDISKLFEAMCEISNDFCASVKNFEELHLIATDTAIALDDEAKKLIGLFWETIEKNPDLINLVAESERDDNASKHDEL